MPLFASQRTALSIAEKAAPCRYHGSTDSWRFSAKPEKPVQRERHQTPIPSLGPEKVSSRPPKDR